MRAYDWQKDKLGYWLGCLPTGEFGELYKNLNS